MSITVYNSMPAELGGGAVLPFYEKLRDISPNSFGALIGDVTDFFEKRVQINKVLCVLLYCTKTIKYL